MGFEPVSRTALRRLSTAFLPALVLTAAFCLACVAPDGAAAGEGPVSSTRLTPVHIAKIQGWMKDKPVGARIAAWAEMFVGVPYDTDPLGAYVRGEKIVCDSPVDCMYLVFRAVELATSDTPEGAETRALDLRFKTRGRVGRGRVTNYDERFAYAEDMVESGKWGRRISAELGAVKELPGERGREFITYLPTGELLAPANIAGLRDGDLVFFVKDPARRVVGEVIGHLGIIKIDGGVPYLIHGSGSKAAAGRPGGGAVKKAALADYLRAMKFIGVQITRFEGAPGDAGCP